MGTSYTELIHGDRVDDLSMVPGTAFLRELDELERAPSGVKRSRAVIGANLGDEGKGVMVDYFAWLSRREARRTLVVRFNGGAQAGHTVQLSNGDRHVFKHYGSGTLVGAETYLSQFCTVHPMLFRGEYDLLAKRVVVGHKLLHVDPRCGIVTPYDMLLNQVIENDRASSRLGSTGTGVSEAVLRSHDPEFTLTVGDLAQLTPGALRRFTQKVTLIRDRYVPRRLAAVGISLLARSSGLDTEHVREPSDTTIRELLASKAVLDNFTYDAAYLRGLIDVTDEQVLRGSYDAVIFEGAQGLLLDQVTGTYPHVTRSRTGVTNIIKLCDAAGIKDVDVTYVTRPYVTRHGAGPLEHEHTEVLFPTDATNVSNPYQGALRYGLLDAGALGERVRADLRQAEPGGVRLHPSLAVTCVDHLRGPTALLKRHGTNLVVAVGDLGQTLAHEVDVQRYYVSHGPTREDVRAYLRGKR